MTITMKRLSMLALPAAAAMLLYTSAPAAARVHHSTHVSGHHHQPSKRSRKGKSSPNARTLFGAVKLPSAQPVKPIGRYDDGCIAGAQEMPTDGPHWQVMRLSRNRNWGTPDLISYLKDLSERVHKHGWNGLLIGDMGMPRGGPMPTGHASHQIGLDVDIWLLPMPDKRLTNEERENLSAISVLKEKSADLDRNVWTQAHENFVRDAAQDDRVARIFVTPAIKEDLCSKKDPHGADTPWLRKLRPWWGHDDHIHVRLNCPKGDGACVAQDPPPEGDGCAEVAGWKKQIAKHPPNMGPGEPDSDVTATKPQPKPPVPMSKLPAACVGVLESKP